MKIDLNKLGKNLKFIQRNSNAKKELSEKEIFIDLISKYEQLWINSESLYKVFKINLLEYEEAYFRLIEDLIFAKYEDWQAEIILWYIYGRVDEDGNIYSLTLNANENSPEQIIIDNPTQLWDFLQRLEKLRNQMD